MQKFETYFKTALIGFLGIAIYFFFPLLEALPFQLQGIDTTTLPIAGKVIYMISFETIIILLMLFCFRKKIKKDMIDIKKNHMNYFSKFMKYWLISLAIMMISNLFIMFITGNQTANNEKTIENLFNISPLYIFFSAVIYAPIVEELVFRQSIRNIIPNKILFIIVSGLVFGGLHVVTDMNSITDLLYLIPYCTPGFFFAYFLAKTDNIFVSMGFHFLHNGLLIALQFLILLFG